MNQSLTAAWPAYNQKAKTTFGTFLTRLGQLFGTGSMEVMDALNACDYLTWAYYHDIDLTFSYLQSDIDTCDSLSNSYYNYVLDVDQGLGYLGANQFLKKILDQLKTLTGALQFHQTFFYQNFMAEKHERLSLEDVNLA